MTTDILKRPQVAAEVSSEDRVRVVEEFTRNERVATTTACFAGRTSLLDRGCYGSAAVGVRGPALARH